jgi:hypothetical protein
MSFICFVLYSIQKKVMCLMSMYYLLKKYG